MNYTRRGLISLKHRIFLNLALTILDILSSRLAHILWGQSKQVEKMSSRLFAKAINLIVLSNHSLSAMISEWICLIKWNYIHTNHSCILKSHKIAILLWSILDPRQIFYFQRAIRLLMCIICRVQIGLIKFLITPKKIRSISYGSSQLLNWLTSITNIQSVSYLIQNFTGTVSRIDVSINAQIANSGTR